GASPEAVVQLLSSYAEQDAAAALSLADLIGIEVPSKLPELVIEHCDQPVFLALMRERAKAEPERMEMWACLFTEAALRSRAVAASLCHLESIPEWSRRAVNVKRDKAWFTFGIARNFLTECFTIAYNSQESLPNSVNGYINKLKSVSSPSKSFTKI